MIHSILDTIGNTPLIYLDKIGKSLNFKSNLYAKLEYFNPFGSIKDRTAMQIINDAEQNGEIASKIVIEATSGNLGIALSAISQMKRYKAIMVMPNNVSKSRISLIEKYGAEVVLTTEGLGMKGAINEAKKIQKYTNGFYSNQFNNLSSVTAHYLNTAKEIDIQMQGKVDIIVCGIGSGGTISGIGKYFKEKNPSIEIIGVLPDVFPHKIQGIGAGFLPSILDLSLVDKVLNISYSEAIESQKILLESNSIYAGISSCAVFACCNKYLNTSYYENKNIVMIFADSGERYT